MTDKVLSIGMVVVVNSVVEGDSLDESRIRERDREREAMVCSTECFRERTATFQW